LALLLAAAAPAKAGPIGYTLDVTTFYQFGAPSPLDYGYTGSPDSGYWTITNSGTSTFTGTIGQVAVSNSDGDFSYSVPFLTLAPGQSLTFGSSTEGSNVGGFNGPFESPQPGVEIVLNGLIDGVEAVNLSVFDKDIHSGVFRTADGHLSDSYVLQGGDPNGGDTGDAFETTQAPGHFEFFEAASSAVPAPGALTMLGCGLVSLFGYSRRKRATA
jgi:hypothetical protein